MSKEGSTISGLMESFATLLSVSLQHGVPLQVVCEKLAHTRFEPSGWTGNEKMGYAKSIMDYIGRWMQYLPTQRDYLYRQQQAGSGSRGTAVRRCSHLPDLRFDLPSERHLLRVRILLNERWWMLLNDCYVRRYTVSAEIAKPGVSAGRAASFSF
jgi:hypothetical protein